MTTRTATTLAAGLVVALAGVIAWAMAANHRGPRAAAVQAPAPAPPWATVAGGDEPPAGTNRRRALRLPPRDRTRNNERPTRRP